MIRLRNTLTAVLALYLVLLPVLARPAAAQLGPRPIDPPGGGRPAFEPRAPATTVTGFNGFEAQSIAGVFPHHDHQHTGGIGNFSSPWGEAMSIRYWGTSAGLAIEFDGELTLHYSFATDGTLREVRAVTADREARTPIGRRAELAALGQLELSSLDLSAYQLADEVLRSNHSDAFLRGVAQLEGPADAACGIQLALCGACILGWAATVPAIAAACVVAGVPTFGLACLAAILTHEATGIACALTCIQAFQECDHDPKGGRPSSCDGPS